MSQDAVKLVPPLDDSGIWDDGALSVSSAADFLDRSTDTIYRLMDSGELPYAKVRGGRSIPKRALVALLKRNQKGGQGAA